MRVHQARPDDLWFLHRWPVEHQKELERDLDRVANFKAEINVSTSSGWGHIVSLISKTEYAGEDDCLERGPLRLLGKPLWSNFESFASCFRMIPNLPFSNVVFASLIPVLRKQFSHHSQSSVPFSHHPSDTSFFSFPLSVCPP